MKAQEKKITKKLGRPATGQGKMIGVRLQPSALAQLDTWIGKQPKPKPSRPEAIRRLIGLGLEAAKKPKSRAAQQ